MNSLKQGFGISINKKMDGARNCSFKITPDCSRSFTPVWRLVRVLLLAPLSLCAMSSDETASAATVTNVFTGVADLSSFGGGTSDEIQFTYTFDDGLAPLSGSSSSSGRYGPITGNVRADSLNNFNLDFNGSNLQAGLLVVSNNVMVFPSTNEVDLYSINFATTENFLFGTDLISGFGLTLIDEDATVFSNAALESGTDFFADIDAINLRFNSPIFDFPAGQSGPQLIVLSRDGASLENVAAVPLPAALPLFGSVLAALGFFGWRRRRQSAVV